MTVAVSMIAVLFLFGLLVDVTFTLFSPFGRHGGSLHRLQNRALWSAFRSLARVFGRGMGSQVLSLAGPVRVLWTVLFWSGWLIVAFALLYLPHLDFFRTLTPAAAPRWLDAIYYSGYVATTLGVGDILATSGPMRLLTVVEAVLGFSLFAVSTTYALTVTREAGSTAVLALEISALRRLLATREVLESGRAVTAGLGQRRAESWAGALVRITDAHRRYPLLHYFRASEEDRSLLVQVGWLVGEADRPLPSAPVGGPAGRLLVAAVDGYLEQLNFGCVPPSFLPLPEGGGTREARYHRLLAHLDWRDEE